MCSLPTQGGMGLKGAADRTARNASSSSKFDPEERMRRAAALFLQLVLGLQQSGMMALGKLMNPLTRKIERNLEAARDTIDTLAALHRVDPYAVGLAEFGKPEGFLTERIAHVHSSRIGSVADMEITFHSGGNMKSPSWTAAACPCASSCRCTRSFGPNASGVSEPQFSPVIRARRWPSH